MTGSCGICQRLTTRIEDRFYGLREEGLQPVRAFFIAIGGSNDGVVGQLIRPFLRCLDGILVVLFSLAHRPSPRASALRAA